MQMAPKRTSSRLEMKRQTTHIPSYLEVNISFLINAAFLDFNNFYNDFQNDVQTETNEEENVNVSIKKEDLSKQREGSC